MPLGGADSLLIERLRASLEEARARTLELVAPVSDHDLERVHDPLLSPLVWDLGHIAAFEDLWLCHNAAGLEPLRPDLMDVYDATETPRARRGDLPYLRRADALAYMDEVRERSLGLLSDWGPLEGLTAGGFVWKLVVAHEHQHNETMLQTLALAEPGVYAPRRRRVPAGAAGAGMVTVDVGEIDLGAPAERFAYDNERPRHRVRVPAFRIDRTPVTNGAYAEFIAAGGYDRREWWSDDGWEWRHRAGAERPLYWTDGGLLRRFDRVEPVDPLEPVMHVSWYEADAFARSQGKRLPTEVEWEAAAGNQVYPWGNEPPTDSRANLDQLAFGPAQVGAFPAGAADSGALGLIGDVWEWTTSDFTAYPGFRAYPYPEYSSIFFGGEYKVLRGGSWATRSGVARSSFRNWDFPQRRQIFSGFRCAVSA